MKTLIISSSLSENSKSFILCNEILKKLKDKGVDAELVDCRELDLRPCHKGITEDMKVLSEKTKACDNIIFGMGVHCYSISDNLKIVLDNCCKGLVGKFFGILCTAGGERSYLSTMHLTQICMNEWRMIQLPRIIYATGKNFDENAVIDKDLNERIHLFVEEFITIGGKLLK